MRGKQQNEAPAAWALALLAELCSSAAADASSINYASLDASSPLPVAKEISTSVTPSSEVYRSNKKLVSNDKECQAHHRLFCLLYFASSQKLWDYGTHGDRVEVDATAPLWMAAKFCCFRAGKSQGCKNVGWKTVDSHSLISGIIQK